MLLAQIPNNAVHAWLAMYLIMLQTNVIYAHIIANSALSMGFACGASLDSI